MVVDLSSPYYFSFLAERPSQKSCLSLTPSALPFQGRASPGAQRQALLGTADPPFPLQDCIYYQIYFLNQKNVLNL